MKRNGVLIRFSLLATAMSACTPVFAEQSLSTAPLSADEAGEILVTARRVSESLQTVPVSVSAVQADEIKQRFAVNILDLEGAAPNVQISRDTTYPASANFSIRGETTLDVARYTEAAVIIALDQVFLPSINGALIDTFDIERLEILRGPQGTLFGRNTIGGVVNIARKKPKMNVLAGDVELTYGSWDRVSVKGALNVPLIADKLAARAAITYGKGGGFARNLYAATDPSVGKRRLGDDTFTGRISLLFTPVPDLEIYANAVFLDGNGDAGAVWNFSEPGFPICQGAGGVTQSCGPQSNRRVWDNRPNINDIKTRWYSAEVNLKKDWGTVTAIASYIDEYQRQALNFDGTELPYYDSIKREDAVTKTLEVRYAGEPLRGVSLQLGGFFMRERNSYFQTNNLFFSTADFPQGASFKSQSDAVFAQLDWKVAPTVRVTGGLRYTRDEKQVVNFYPLAIGPDFQPAPIETVGGLRKVFRKPTYRIGADWQASDQVFAYVSYARGYRAGGFNGRAGSLASATVPFDPEVADSYEVGTKFTLLDRRLRLNLAAFRVDKKDLQVENLRSIIFNGVPVIDGVIDNAATARIQGLEAEVSLSLPGGTKLGATLGYIDGTYRNYVTPCGGGVCTPGTIIDLSGKRLRRTPKFQYSINAEQRVRMEWGTLIANANWRWKSSQEFIIDNDPRGHQESYGLLDASLTYRVPNERISLSVFGKNLTDKQYKDFAYIVSTLGFTFGSLNRPREWGVQASYSF